MLRIHRWNVGTTLAAAPYPDAWDGSLWTLWFEFGAYLVAGVALIVPFTRRHGALVFGLLTAATIIGLPLARGPLDVTTNLYLNGLRLAAFFCTGMFLYFVRNRVPRGWWVGASALGVLLVLGLAGLAEAWGQIPYGILLLWLGSTLPLRWGSRNDLSYGIYIYAFPMQQFLAITLGTRLPFLLTCLIALAATIPWAAGSWFLVEQPALRLKQAVPGSLHLPAMAASALLPRIHPTKKVLTGTKFNSTANLSGEEMEQGRQ